MYELEDVVGKSAKLTIAENKVINSKLITLPMAVERGNRVKVFVRSGALEVSTIGTALENGVIGESIKVKNVDSNKVIQAEVLDSQTVEIVVY